MLTCISVVGVAESFDGAGVEVKKKDHVWDAREGHNGLAVRTA